MQAKINGDYGLHCSAAKKIEQNEYHRTAITEDPILPLTGYGDRDTSFVDA